VHALWEFVNGFLQRCPDARIPAPRDPDGRKVFARINAKRC